MRVGLARLPSGFDPGRYRRMRADSSSPAWLLGAAGLLVPLFSVVGVLSGYRATKLGNRLGAAAATWCVLTAAVSVAMWASLFTGEASPSPSPFALAVTDVTTDAIRPAGLTFASTMPPTHYSVLDLTVTNESSEDAPLSPTSIEVQDASGQRLAWATTDETFLATTNLPAGASIEANLYVALPTGSAMASMSLGEARVDF